jgi:hypothetical protein
MILTKQETVMRSLIVPAAAAVALLGLGTFPAAALTSAGHAMATALASDAIPASSNSHRRPHYRVNVPRYRQGWVPPRLRGFDDPGFAYHGNINGCVVDLGYGRWESCNVGR